MDKIISIQAGTRWRGVSNHVIVIYEIKAEDGHEWIYYRDADVDTPREYSCYKESFLDRYSIVQ